MEFLAHRLFIEHAQHRVFSMDGRHDGDAEINGPPAVTHPEAPILRHAALGNIQLAHHLNARNDGGMVFFGNGLHGLLQHAINAVLDDHRIVARLNMNVAGAPLQGGENGGIHQADDGTHLAVGSQPLDGNILVATLIFADHVEGESLARLLQHSLRLLSLLQDVVDLGKGRDFGADRAP